ncbi:hypothetical protein FPQ18DRAFT_351591 [Pyronema domesticum]|nr:hypothetical protein FPQ18DRAFT_351591 [Pyronema domesticum]
MNFILLKSLFIVMPLAVIGLPAQSPAAGTAEASDGTVVVQQFAYLQYCRAKDYQPREWCQFRSPPFLECQNLSGMWDNSITSYRVYGRCCAFYRNHDCNDKLFDAQDRSHGQLGPAHNDQISSYKCNGDCSGL